MKLLAVLAAAALAGCGTGSAERREMERSAPTGRGPTPSWLLLSPIESSPGPYFYETRTSILDEELSFGIDLFRVVGVTPRPKRGRESDPSTIDFTDRVPDLRFDEILELTREMRYAPDDPWLYERRGRLWADLGWRERARRDLQRARVLREGSAIDVRHINSLRILR